MLQQGPQLRIGWQVRVGFQIEGRFPRGERLRLGVKLRRPSRELRLLLGAIVVRGTAGETKLLLPPLSTLRERAELAVKRNQTRDRLELGKLQTVTRDFFLFRLA